VGRTLVKRGVSLEHTARLGGGGRPLQQLGQLRQLLSETKKKSKVWVEDGGHSSSLDSSDSFSLKQKTIKVLSGGGRPLQELRQLRQLLSETKKQSKVWVEEGGHSSSLDSSDSFSLENKEKNFISKIERLLDLNPSRKVPIPSLNASLWIQIRIRIVFCRQDLDPGGRKWPTYTGKMINFIFFKCWMFSFGG
jgi:hypothetical protein